MDGFGQRPFTSIALGIAQVPQTRTEELANGHTQMPRQTRRLCMAVGQIEPHCNEIPGAAQPSQMLGLLAPGYGYACPLGKQRRVQIPMPRRRVTKTPCDQQLENRTTSVREGRAQRGDDFCDPDCLRVGTFQKRLDQLRQIEHCEWLFQKSIGLHAVVLRQRPTGDHDHGQIRLA
ncbi:hypothetical protein TBK1r_46960 [Stieleria magnilauensis]|uniref:Uncharacterized protein n=1 Tax=Stieleria magnilauensis TaxID=2527963 RepID=A0ABX5XYB0_9BACT|nr:hypothetical protein TBK1r_46960 [Planctomycetes bacterium TBK1r]